MTFTTLERGRVVQLVSGLIAMTRHPFIEWVNHTPKLNQIKGSVKHWNKEYIHFEWCRCWAARCVHWCRAWWARCSSPWSNDRRSCAPQTSSTPRERKGKRLRSDYAVSLRKGKQRKKQKKRKVLDSIKKLCHQIRRRFTNHVRELIRGVLIHGFLTDVGSQLFLFSVAWHSSTKRCCAEKPHWES